MKTENQNKTGFALKVMLLLGLLVLSKYAKDEREAFAHRNQIPQGTPVPESQLYQQSASFPFMHVINPANRK